MRRANLRRSRSAVFDDPELVAKLQWYFGVGAAPDAIPAYTGGWFERLGGGGDRPEVANRSLRTTLSRWRCSASRSLHRSRGICWRDRWAKRSGRCWLRSPWALQLVDDRAEQHVTEDSPAWAAWELLNGQPGVAWVKAGKLLARKRPHLLAVYDDVVRCGAPDHFWSSLRNTLRADGRAFQDELEGLRTRAGLDGLSVLRVFDVAMWRSHEQEHRQKGIG